MKLYLIDERQLNALKRHARRLYTEDRMNGDEMRDMAQSIDAIVHVCEQLESTEK